MSQFPPADDQQPHDQPRPGDQYGAPQPTPNQPTPNQPAPNQPAPNQGAPNQDQGRPAGNQYGQPATPYGGHQQAAVDPNRTLGLIGLILAFLTSIVGLVISAVALRRSKKAGFKNGFALAGVIVGIVTTISGLVIAGLLIFATTSVLSQCKDLGSGTHQVDGVTYTCP